MIKWLFTLLCMVGFVLLMNNKKMEMKSVFNDYKYVKSPWAKEQHVNRARGVMRPRLIPYVLEIYTSGQDIEFAEAMIDACDSSKGTDRLWEIALDEDSDSLARTICLAHLLNRDELRAWTEITEQDINAIAASMPAHVVHWKHLLVKYLGLTHSYLSKDTFPERHKFKAAMRRCRQQYSIREEYRQKMNEQIEENREMRKNEENASEQPENPFISSE